MVKIVSWNVNGLRTLKPSLAAVLVSLDADIVCFQETRITQNDTDLERLALVPGWHSFFSFCTVRDGYSGVATYTRTVPTPALSSIVAEQALNQSQPRPNVTPLDANEGFRGSIGGAEVEVLMNPVAEKDNLDRDEADEYAVELDSGYAMPETVYASDYDLLRDEGRAVITDHGLFVLINVYVPAVSVEGRARFKLAFCRALELKVRALRLKGRHVIIVGDWNIAPAAIDVAHDVCDPDSWNKRPARAWLRDVMLDELGLLDSFRVFHPRAKAAFTCWSEATRARENNFGVRIDLIVCNEELFRSHVQSSSVVKDMLGSDHCPVALALDDTPFMSESLPTAPPPFCSTFLPRFSTKQVSIRDLLPKTKVHPANSPDCVVCCAPLCFCPGRSSRPPPDNPPRMASTKAMKRLHSPLVQAANSARPRPQQATIQSFFKTASANVSFPTKRQKSGQSTIALNDSAEEANNIALSAYSADSSTTAEKSAKDEATAKQWRRILPGPARPPLCRHNLPCVVRVVKKP
jgi:AP endonuclease 2